MKIVITGAGGLLGGHAAARIHALNCTAGFKGETAPFELVMLDHRSFNNDSTLSAALANVDAVLHFAGVNRATDTIVEQVNPKIAERLAYACLKSGVSPHVIFSNSVHSDRDTPYGRSKRITSKILSKIGEQYTDLVLPHLFGEGARPNYNNVTATFISAVISGATPQINPNGKVSLLHAGAAAQIAIDAATKGQFGCLNPKGKLTSIKDLFMMLQGFHQDYENNIFPNLQDHFTLSMFNSYRTALYPDTFPRHPTLKKDERGTLFEVAKGGGGGQFFSSWTEPGFTRGNHFHLNKVERFLVLNGEAIIRMRHVINGPIWEYPVNGNVPAVVDIPTLYTHSIENVGHNPLQTMFWTHDLFDPVDSDTFQDPVQKV